MMMMMYIVLILVFLGYVCRYINLEVEGFLENYKVIAIDAFPCRVPITDNSESGSSGCYYHELNGCAVFPANQTSQKCPATVTEFERQIANPTDDPAAKNEDIFELVYDAMKSTSAEKSDCSSAAPCDVMDFFQKIKVMTDAEMNAYQKRVKNEPCSIGGRCMLPENVASYVSTSQADAIKSKTDCKTAANSQLTIGNEYSRGLEARVFPQCRLKA